MDIGAALNLGNPNSGQTPGYEPPQQPGAPPMGGQPPGPGPQAMAPARNIADEWNSFMGRPEAKAMMLQMGLALMQPVGLGQSGIGHFANAMGQGAAAAGRYKTQKEKAALDQEKLAVDRLQAQTQGGLTIASQLANDRALGADFQGFLHDFVKSEVTKRDPYGTKGVNENDIMVEIQSDPSKYQQVQQLWLQSRNYPGRTLASAPPTAPGAVAGAVTNRTPNAAAIALLKKDPSIAPQFDKTFGPGSAAKYLQGG